MKLSSRSRATGPRAAVAPRRRGRDRARARPRAWPWLRLRTRTLLLQCAVVTLVVGTAFGAFAYDSEQRLTRQYQHRALAVARTVAGETAVREAADRWSTAAARSGGGAAHASRATLVGSALNARAETVRRQTDALFVVVTDDRGIRLTHPDPAELGRKVSTDPSTALSGHEELARHRAHLGEEVVAKVPVRAPGSRKVVGEANVGVSADAVRAAQTRVLLGGLGWLVVALLVGLAASVLLARRWKRLTLGLEPEELATLVQEQEAVLHGIGEGVLALDARERVTVANDEVRALLGVDAAPGTPVTELGLTARVRAVLREPDAGRAVMAVVRERVLVVSARTVRREGRRLGTLLTVQDRTAVESLTRQLDAVRTMSGALRAQRHEFANRLHLLSGLVHSGQSARAAGYLDSLLAGGPLGETLPDLDPEAVRDSSLRAFLSAKAAAARERGVTLVLGGSTWVRRTVAAPVDVTTVLGNLVDNAVDAAGAGRRVPRRVEVELIGVRDELLVTVADTGDGVPAARRHDLFDEGVSTKEPGADAVDSVGAVGAFGEAGGLGEPGAMGVPGVPGGPGERGIGLALARQIARTRGGDLHLTAPGAPPAPPAAPGPGPGGGEAGAGEAEPLGATLGTSPGTPPGASPGATPGASPGTPPGVSPGATPGADGGGGESAGPAGGDGRARGTEDAEGEEGAGAAGEAAPPSGPDDRVTGGAVFVARLPGALAPDDDDPDAWGDFHAPADSGDAGGPAGANDPPDADDSAPATTAKEPPREGDAPARPNNPPEHPA